jgi:hypothetical protein
LFSLCEIELAGIGCRDRYITNQPAKKDSNQRLGRSTHRHTIGPRRGPFSRLTEDGFVHRTNFSTRFKACPQRSQRTIILKRTAATRSIFILLACNVLRKKIAKFKIPASAEMMDQRQGRFARYWPRCARALRSARSPGACHYRQNRRTLSRSAGRNWDRYWKPSGDLSYQASD